jgi:SAM-dependent methyltransferase
MQTSVLGIDVAPTPIDEASFPPNLSLEVYDINLGLSHFEGQIDLLHMRCVAGGIHDMTQMLQELQRCLKPGGLLLVVDGDVSTLCEDRKTVMPFKRLPDDGGPEVTGVSEQGSWFGRVFWGECIWAVGTQVGTDVLL